MIDDQWLYNKLDWEIKGQKGRITKWQEKIWRRNVNVYNQDCSYGFTAVFMHQKHNKCVQFTVCQLYVNQW